MDDFMEDFDVSSACELTGCSGIEEADSFSYDATPAEVVQQIEKLTSLIFTQLGTFGTAPDLVIMRATAGWQGEQSAQRTMSLMDKQGIGALAYTRTLCLLNMVHELLLNDEQASQRDIYYRLKHLRIFSTPEHVNQAIQGLVGLLHVPRAALGIVCSSRGVYCGRVAVCEGPGCPWVDCSLVGGCGKAVPGNCRTIAGYQFVSDARYLVVVEKDAVYQRLVDDDFCALANCIMVTAKGMPDVATRAFVHHLLAAAPHLTAVALVDWNPSGAAILAAYKYGSQRMCEAARYTAPGLRWLGARGAQLHCMAQPALQGPLSQRDRSLIATLRAGALAAEPAWLDELQAMEELDAKAELEALYGHPAGFAQLLADSLASGDFE